jgi:two-component system chemotaxis response regulator CheY
MRALLVDDSGTMRRILKTMLTPLGFESVTEAADGAEAVKNCRTLEYDLILMDWNMPNLTGIEALKQIRAAGSKAPVIMVTTEAEQARVLDALKAGANNYIVKPFNQVTIEKKVRETLERANKISK